MMDSNEREVALRKMDETIQRFYSAAVNIGVHPFIEFAGVLTAYAKSCRRAHGAGIDFTECNRHGGRELPVEDFELSYLMEKLGCIFGERRVCEAPQWKPLRSAPKDGRQIMLLPSAESRVWISAWWTHGRWHETASGAPLTVSAASMWAEAPALPQATETQAVAAQASAVGG